MAASVPISRLRELKIGRRVHKACVTKLSNFYNLRVIGKEKDRIMRQSNKFYIDGEWVAPAGAGSFAVINPATEEVAGEIAMGNAVDADRAVRAARNAFASFSRTDKAERVELIDAILEEYRVRIDDLADAITEEMGAPSKLAKDLHARIGHIHLKIAQKVLQDFAFRRDRGGSMLAYEPIGVCALITPWNWPINQIAAKVAPALATGCTMVLKPSEYSPFSAQIWTEVFDKADVPAGVFNMIQGTGPEVGEALASHPEVDMVSFTGSTGAGIEVARAAAPTVKRVHQELGGKSAFVILPDADMELAAEACFRSVISNAGQSCNAPTRMLVPNAAMAEVANHLATVGASIRQGDPKTNPDVGPVVSKRQYDRIQALIEKGMAEGATLAVGGPGRPDDLARGYFVRPTVFSHVTNDMAVAQEEIFGPVLCVLGYEDVDEAIAIANDTPYGLAGYIQGRDSDQVNDVASRLRVGQVLINSPHPDGMAPFGGYKMSGNGREWGDHGFESFLEVKAILGSAASKEVAA